MGQEQARARLTELQSLRKGRGLSEAEWEEAALLFAELGDRDEADRCRASAAAIRRRRQEERERMARDGKPKPRTVLGVMFSRQGLAIFRRQLALARAAARQAPPRRTAPEDVIAAIGVVVVLFFAFAFDTSVGGDGERVHNVGLMQDRMVGIIIGLALLFGGLLRGALGKR